MADKPWKKWERTVAERFSRWLSYGKCPKVICRQALMGRMVERIYGDMAIHPNCPDKYRPMADWFMKTFIVDAKNRKSFRLASLLTSPKHEFFWWHDKLLGDAVRAGGKRPIMVLLDKPTNVHVVAFGKHLRTLLEMNGVRIYESTPMMVLAFGKDDEDGGSDRFMFCLFEGWLKAVDPVGLGCPEVENVLPDQTQ